jgi:hypothetical protein
MDKDDIWYGDYLDWEASRGECWILENEDNDESN